MKNRPPSKLKKSATFALLASAALSGCEDNLGHEVHAPQELQSTQLPFLVEDGTRFPYFEYSTDKFSLWKDQESELAVFVYPILSARNKGLALPHMPTQQVRELFGEELFGRQFSVINDNHVLSIDEIPVSRPIDINAKSNWEMMYQGASYACKVTRQVGANFSMRCDSKKITLNHQLNISRGFTSYQDFCSNGLCTYKLKSSVGILSAYHLDLLAERPNNSFKPTPLRGVGKVP